MRRWSLRAVVVIGLLSIAAIAAAQSAGTELTTDDPFVAGLGESGAVDGDLAVLGAPYDSEAGSDAGAAYIFERTGESWQQVTKLASPDSTTGQLFGMSVAIAGDTIAVGAPAIFEDGALGAAYVFRQDGSGSWGLEASLASSLTTPDDRFGTALALDGDRLAIGAPTVLYDGSALGEDGTVQIYTRTGTSWSETAILSGDGGFKDDSFGFAVDLDGDRILVGARADFRENTVGFQGEAFVFDLQPDGSWTQTERLLSPIRDDGELQLFGTSVSLSGDVAVVAERTERNVYVFEFDGTAWALANTLVGSSDGFGDAVDIAADRLVVAENNGFVPPVAYVYESDGTGWQQTAGPLTVSDEVFDDEPLAVSDPLDGNAYVTLDGSTLLAGKYVYEFGPDPDLQIFRGQGIAAPPESRVGFTRAVDALPAATRFTLCNEGEADLHIANPGNIVTGAAFFQLAPTPPATLSAGECAPLRVGLSGAVGTHQGSLSVASDDPDTPTYTVLMRLIVVQ